MTSVKKTYEIGSPVDNVWEALVDPNEISAWGGGRAEMSDKEGAEFRLWSGDIFGKNTKVVENKQLNQDWYAGKWDKPSKVEIRLSFKDNKTHIDLTHTNIPDDEFESISNGWDDYYFGPMKQYLESN